jgi:uncharacterized protein YecE (DUF72 family)
MNRSVEERREDVARFELHDVHPQLHFGTASDRYAAWIGQVYPKSWEAKVETRRKATDKGSIEERTLPIESVKDYFAHFTTLELDFTFYNPLLKADGSPTSAYFVMEEYASHAPQDAQFLVKAPQTFFSRTVRRQKKGEAPRYEANAAFLDAKGYTEQFHKPLLHVLGHERIAGVLFQQEYQRMNKTPPVPTVVAELARFFQDIPNDLQAHLELRSEHLLVPAYFDLLAQRGLGFVFSHWTWLPALRDQWRLCRQGFSAADGRAVLRLLSPRQMSYSEAFAKAYPFTQAVPELSATPQAKEMVNETAALIYHAIAQEKELHIILNNRAWGNSPLLGQAVANRFLDFAERKGA